MTHHNRGLLFQRSLAGIVLATLTFGGGLVAADQYISSGRQAALLPAPERDVLAGSALQTAVFAGGCFWGTQGVFEHVVGVKSVVAGYAGGSAETASYEQTESGRTDHAEAVRVVFNAQEISYGELLRIFFSAAHDPTQLDRQGPDVGRQYRSAIFPQTNEQATVALKYIEQLRAAKAFQALITTSVEAGKTFYPAEPYHQDYLNNHLDQPYIVIYELPRIETLKRLFPQHYREDPVLVSSKG
ncbi:peptide-methionine (S)-S-oxide reductase MsrA [Rhizobium aegyptiacum]|uniref:peptide-methionine (S)-S-oxide reductase MsrA n=1 Tax=Rhizobium aegyptiacum TaxID=1764550 RepID=UPI0007E58A31|nr:peptide-methionine (S)-S-oxide reductase MsrA [Rhizobium aegyptiacum]